MNDITERADREFRVQLTLQEVDRTSGEVLTEAQTSGSGLADTSRFDREIAYASALAAIKFITDMDRAHGLLDRFMAERDKRALA